jgi:hypothetical protein
MRKRESRNRGDRCQFARCRRPAVAQAPYHRMNREDDPDEDRPLRFCQRHGNWWSSHNPRLRLIPLRRRVRW